MEAKLTAWREQGFTTAEQVQAARMRIRALNEQLRGIYRAAGLEKRANQPDRDLMTRWLGEMGMSMELVLLAAEYARGSGAPMMAADKILGEWKRKGISTTAGAREEHESHVRGGARTAYGAPPQDQLSRYTPEERRATYSAAVVDLDEEDDG